MRLSNFPLFVFLSFIISVIAQGELGIKLDEAARGQGHFVFTSKVTYDSSTNELFTGPELYGLARQAWNEMVAGWSGIGKRNQPGMMAALTVGNSVYFSSSAKGDNFFYRYANPDGTKFKVQEALDACQLSLSLANPAQNKPHYHAARCAEIMAFHQFMRDPDVPLATKNDPGPIRVVAYGAGRQKPENAKPFEPCGSSGSPDTWGCAQFTQSAGIEVPPTVPVNEVVDKNPAPTPVSTTQIGVCVAGAQETGPARGNPPGSARL